MPRIILGLACLIGLVVPVRPALGQSPDKSIILEILLPEDARLFLEGQDTKSTGAMRTFESPPLPPGKYTYTIKAILTGPKGPQTVTRRLDVRPGDFESVDLRPRREGERVPDVLFEGTPPKVVEKLLELAKLKADDVLWDLGCGDGRIPVTAARMFGIEARGFEIDPKYVAEARVNVQKSGVGKRVVIENRDIFTLDLSRGPTVVTLYLLPSLNAKLLPQLQKLPAGARVLSVEHRLADIPPDQQITVATENGDYHVYLWRVETLRNHPGAGKRAGGGEG
jgi:uncharacterized protein (TIGR03000 family)